MEKDMPYFFRHTDPGSNNPYEFWYWRDDMCEEEIGPFETEAMALYDYIAVRLESRIKKLEDVCFDMSKVESSGALFWRDDETGRRVVLKMRRSKEQ